MEMGSVLALHHQPSWHPIGFQSYLSSTSVIVLESQLKDQTWCWLIERQDEQCMPQVRALFKKIQEALNVRASAVSQERVALFPHMRDLHLMVFGPGVLRFAYPLINPDMAWGHYRFPLEQHEVLYLPDVYAMDQAPSLKRDCWQCLRRTFGV